MMGIKLFAGLIAAIMVVAYLLPVVVKLKEIPLIVVVSIGVVLMLIDLWATLRGKVD